MMDRDNLAAQERAADVRLSTAKQLQAKAEAREQVVERTHAETVRLRSRNQYADAVRAKIYDY